MRRRNAGFTLSELLASLLILAMVTMVIASGVTVVKRSYDTITRRAEADVLLSTCVTSLEDEFRYATNIRTSNGVITYDSLAQKLSDVHIDTDTDNGIRLVSGVTGASAALVSDKLATRGLSVSVTDLSLSRTMW